MATHAVLVVEDDEGVRTSLVELLESAGYRAAGARNGRDALACLEEVRPDLILLDMVMPVMDGFEFLARLRRDPRWAGIPLIITSELGEELRTTIDARGSRVLRIVGFAPKPFEPLVVVAQVREALRPPEEDGDAG